MPASKGHQTRERILDATNALLHTKSAQFFSLSDVAERAGVSAALIIRHFGSKDELVFQTIIHRSDVLGEAEINAALVKYQSPTWIDFVEIVASFDFARAKRARDLMSMSWWWIAGEEDAFQKAMQPRRETLRALLAKEFDPPLSAETLETLVDLLALKYTDTVRIAFIRQQTATDAKAEVFRTMGLVFEAFRIVNNREVKRTRRPQSSPPAP